MKGILRPCSSRHPINTFTAILQCFYNVTLTWQNQGFCHDWFSSVMLNVNMWFSPSLSHTFTTIFPYNSRTPGNHSVGLSDQSIRSGWFKTNCVFPEMHQCRLRSGNTSITLLSHADCAIYREVMSERNIRMQAALGWLIEDRKIAGTIKVIFSQLSNTCIVLVVFCWNIRFWFAEFWWNS